MSGYAIGGVLSQLTSGQMTFGQVTSSSKVNLTKADFGQWYRVVYFLRKIILVKTWYKTHNTEFYVII